MITIFTVSRQRVLDSCDELVKRKVGMMFDARSRINLIEDEIELLCDFMIALPASNFEPLTWEEHFSQEELINCLSLAHIKFYKRSSYIWQQLFKIKMPAELFRKVKGRFKSIDANVNSSL